MKSSPKGPLERCPWNILTTPAVAWSRPGSLTTRACGRCFAPWEWGSGAGGLELLRRDHVHEHGRDHSRWPSARETWRLPSRTAIRDLIAPCSACYTVLLKTNRFLRESPELKQKVDRASGARPACIYDLDGRGAPPPGCSGQRYRDRNHRAGGQTKPGRRHVRALLRLSNRAAGARIRRP